MKKIKKVCINADCKKKGQSQEVNKFNNGSRVCKSCHSKRVQNDKNIRINKELAKLIDKAVIEANELESANLLYRSCSRAIEDCSRNRGIYRDVSIAWDDPLLMMEEIIMKKEGFWEEWKKQSEIYFKSNRMLSARATLDRIKEDGDYTFDNIQMLSHGENSKKARVKPLNVAVVSDDDNVVDILEYQSVTEAVNQLEIKHSISWLIDSGETYKLGDGRTVMFKSKAKFKK